MASLKAKGDLAELKVAYLDRDVRQPLMELARRFSNPRLQLKLRGLLAPKQ